MQIFPSGPARHENGLGRDVDLHLPLLSKPNSAYLFGGMRDVEGQNAGSYIKKNYQ